MSKINRHPVRRTAAGVLAGTLALTGAVATAAPANALPGFSLERIAGENRYQTSARIAAAFGASSGAILASGETGRSVDALSANFLAGVRGVPVLLTQRDRVPAEVMARLNALTGARNVTIVGGTVAVSAAVETQLRSMGFTVTRLGGEDRYATSEEIIRAGGSAASTVGLVASGLSFPDALAGAPLSYKGKHPVFLTAGGSIPQDTIDAMVAAGTRSVIILGGTAAVPASVEAALVARGITIVTRLGGAGRSQTSRIVADYLIANFGFTNTTFNLASGAPRLEGVDALSGGALSGKQNRTLLITDTETSAAPVVAFARDRANTLNAVGNIFGGPAAVSIALELDIERAGQAGTAGPATLTATSVAQGGALTGTLTGDFSSVTVSGCGFNNQSIGTDSDSTTAGRQFSLGVPAAQQTGTCDVVFTFTPAGGGATTTQTVSVNVTAGGLRVTPDETATLQAVANPDTVTTDNRTYTVGGLTAGVEYRATLVLAGNVTTNAQGQSVFADADNDNLADTGTVTADITQVNGAAPSNNTGRGSTGTATGGTTSTVVFTAQADGTATFVVDGDQAESVRPVVYVNGGGTSTTPAQGGTSPRLELDANNVPTEAFDLGGVTTFTAPAVQSATVRPELQSAQIVSTTTTALASTTNPAGTVVRYTFDETVQNAGALAPRDAAFLLYNNAGERISTTPDVRAVNGSSVDVLFPSVNMAALAGAITLATVDTNAVTDQQGDTNPEGDAALGAAGGGGSALAAGVTQGPDLVSVGGFRQTATAGVSAVDFVFDEAATLASTATAGSFRLIGTDNVELQGSQISTSTTTAGGQNVAGGNGTRTITVLFDNPATTTSPVASEFARGTVEAGAVFETTDDESSPDGVDSAPLQAADVSNGGNTIAPDLVAIELRPNASATANDQALFAFDQPVLRDPDTGAVAGAGAGQFILFETDASQETGTTAIVNSADPRQVLVTFDADATDRVVGGIVTDAAVSSTSTPRVLNQQDEVGVANTNTDSGQTPGRTADPDLTGVALSQGRDQFGNATGFRAAYTFDEAVDATPVNGRFFLYLADGTRLTGSGCTTGTTLSGTGQDNNVVSCTSFTLPNGTTVTSANLGTAVLGTVDDGAVQALDNGDNNPEGAEFTTGGSGTRSS